MGLPKFRSEWKQLYKAGFFRLIESDSLDEILNHIKQRAEKEIWKDSFYLSDFYLTRGKYVGCKDKYVLFSRRTDDR